MSVTISDVMRHVRNHFVTDSINWIWMVIDGVLQPADYFTPGQWIAILDGPFKGVWQLDENGAIPIKTGAAWKGDICLLDPPSDFLRLCTEIADWVEKHPDPTVLSERFGEYSRSRKEADWTQVFASALAPYTRMYAEVKL